MHVGYNLSWNSYSEHLEALTQDLCKSSRFSDITLICDDHRFHKAHKFILSASSDVFKTILCIDLNSPPMIYLRGIHHRDLELILSFIYNGQVAFEQDRLQQFLNVAKDLQIYGIEDSPPPSPYDAQDNISKWEADLEDEEYEEAAAKETLHEMLPLDSVKLFNPKNPKIRKAQCPVCKNIYNNRSKLKIHHETRHEGVRWPCSLCDHQSRDKSALRKHILSKHKPESQENTPTLL